MSDDVVQAELDKRMRITAEERAILRSGQIPEKFAKGAANVGCMTWGAAALGAVAGAIFGLNVWSVLPRAYVPSRGVFVAATALVGLVASWIAFRRRFGRLLDAFGERLRRGRVRVVTVDARLESPDGSTFAQLVASDGRRFQCPGELRGFAFEGRARVAYLDLADLPAAGEQGEQAFDVPQQALAIEVLESR